MSPAPPMDLEAVRAWRDGMMKHRWPAATELALEHMGTLLALLDRTTASDEVAALKGHLSASEESRKFWFDAAGVENARAEAAEAKCDALQRRVVELVEALRDVAARNPMIVHGPGDPFVRISTAEHRAIKALVSSPSLGDQT